MSLGIITIYLRTVPNNVISDNGNVYFLEGNINPGIYWGENEKKDEVMTKIVIRLIVKEMVRRTQKVITGSIVQKIPSKSIPAMLQLLTPLPKEVV